MSITLLTPPLSADVFNMSMIWEAATLQAWTIVGSERDRVTTLETAVKQPLAHLWRFLDLPSLKVLIHTAVKRSPSSLHFMREG
jgi:hypothetical protein